MKTKIVLIASILSSFFINSTCDKDESLHDSIKFSNNSNKLIFVRGNWEYPDTSINFTNPALAGSFYQVDANSSDDPLRITDTYEGRFAQHDTFMVFVFDSEVLETSTWDEVTENYLVLKRYDLSLEDLHGMNWTISYP